ncbi:uncharacterized protein LOC123431018 [Hordeum vulgare subsp. vulgare]|uniref:uncharacterized protein LOC123431018 n=1 Tax=Hordeum vulgare subsp. vulgare TaxID=112509 RepID=UPI001D1A3AAB|nr:uncharacterized protein LOC123431018 [Hordeum vulgare subsp. vulgare]
MGSSGLPRSQRSSLPSPCYRTLRRRLGFCRARSPAPARELLHLPSLQADLRRVAPPNNLINHQLLCRTLRPVKSTDSIGQFFVVQNTGEKKVTVGVQATSDISSKQTLLPLSKGESKRVNISYSSPNGGEALLLLK